MDCDDLQLRRTLLQVELERVVACLATQAKCWVLAMPYSGVGKDCFLHYELRYLFLLDWAKAWVAFLLGLEREVGFQAES